MRLKPEWKGAWLTLLCITLILVGIWIYIGLRIGIWTPIQYDRYDYLTRNLPVAYLLWHKEMQPGDDAEKLVKDRHPHMITRFDPWIEMRWFPGGQNTNTFLLMGMCVIAKNGKLVYASSYSDDGVDERIFFNNLTPTDEVEEQTALHTYLDKLQAEREKSNATNVNQLFLSQTNQTR